MTELSEFERELLEKEIKEDELDMASPSEAREAVFSKHESSGRSKVAIVVGHSRKRQGAKAVEPINQTEYIWNDKLANMIQADASRSCVDCSIFYRDGVGIKGAYSSVRNWNATTFIELHFNAATVPAKGTETLFGAPKVSKDWANIVQREMLSVLARSANENRGIKKRLEGERGGRNVNQLESIPSVLVEPFFGHVESESTLGATQMEDYAASLVKAHLAFVGMYS